MRRIGTFAAALIALAACGEDQKPQPERVGTVINVPLEASFPEAVARAQMNDTIRVAAQVALDSTVTVQSGQTPLVIIGGKVASLLSPEDPMPALVFVSPAPGTEVRNLYFVDRGGTEAISLPSGGTLILTDSEFEGFPVQVSTNGGSLAMTGNVMADPALFSVQTVTGTSVQARNNTLVGAGDCAFYIGTGSTLTANNNLITGYVNYGIACIGSGALSTRSGCNNLFDADETGLPYLNCTPPAGDSFEDPLYCGPESGDYMLAQDSPCLAKEACGLVGALGVGCATRTP